MGLIGPHQSFDDCIGRRCFNRGFVRLPDNEKIAGSAMNRLGASEASPKGAYQG